MTMTDGEEAGKLFVGGLSWETSKDNLQQYFSQYGEVVDSVVMKNPATGRSRGFGFVTFKDSNCVSLVLSAGPHELDGRTIDPKACTPKSEQQKGKRDDGNPKIFLGGLPPDITETEIRNAFMEYGRVADVVIMYDQEKKKSRGFGFLSYDSEDSVEQACAQRFVTINGKQIECKRAEPRSASRRGGRSDNQWGGDGMGGQSRSWGSSPQSMGTSASNGSLSSGYQSWGSQVQQAPYTQPSTYGGGYQNWNSSTGYSTAPSTYGQSSYSGYGAPPPTSGYSYTQGPGAAVTSSQVATDPLSSPSATSAAANAPPPQSSNPYGSMGSYTQDSSTYGPSRGYTGSSDNTQTFGSSQGYGSSTSTYGSYGDNNQSNRSQGAGQQSYHPYRR